MPFPRRAILPLTLVGVSILLGGWFLQEGVSRQENVFLQVRLFQEVVDHVTEQYVEETDPGSLYDAAIQGLLGDLEDPNTSFIEASDWEDFRIQATEGDYGGVGLEVVGRDDYVTVVTTIPGGPGERAGIRPGDRFVEIADQPAVGMSVNAAVEILRGERGTDVDVVMERPGVDERIDFTLTRETIQLRSVPFQLTLDDGVGYVPLQVFRATSSDEVSDAIRELVDAGARGIVLDLRGNPGGLLDEGIEITELFIESGRAVVETRGRGAGQSETYESRAEPIFPDVPLAVLVNESSASASEIVAGALQDYDRALVIGAPTFGKGSVQTLFRLTGGNVLRLTTAHWYTPVGRSIQRELDEGEARISRGAWTLDNRVVSTAPLDSLPEFQSVSGRTLLGGGGIVPDLRVIPDTLTTREAEAVEVLFQRAGLFNRTLFNFAVNWIQRNDVRPDFRVTGAMVEAFRVALRDAGVTVPAGTLEAADRYVRYQLESEIALQAFGQEGRFRHLRGRDRQLQAALDALRQAESTTSLVAGVTAAGR